MYLHVTEKTMQGTDMWLHCERILHLPRSNTCCSMVISSSQVAEFAIKLKAFDNTK